MLFDSAHISLAISIASASLAIVSLAFAVYSWRQANRPLVSVRISTFSDGETGTTLTHKSVIYGTIWQLSLSKLT
jgi:hypothetical protein